jgi:hypothetical protein
MVHWHNLMRAKGNTPANTSCRLSPVACRLSLVAYTGHCCGRCWQVVACALELGKGEGAMRLRKGHCHSVLLSVANSMFMPVLCAGEETTPLLV